MNPNDKDPLTPAELPQVASPAAPELATTDVVAPVDVVAPKPRRRRVVTALAADAGVVAAGPTDIVSAAAVNEAPARPVTVQEAPAPLEVVQQEPALLVAVHQEPPPPVAVPEAPPPRADAPMPPVAQLDAAPAPTQADLADDEGQRRRNRNRRRGRRGDDSPLPEGATVLTISAGADDDDDDDDNAAAAAGDGQAGAPDQAVIATADEAGPPVAPVPAMPVDAGETFADVLSGAFDAEPVDSPEATGNDRRVLSAEPDSPKLHKVLAQAGIGSRRDMEELIASGQVQVNGEVAHTGQRISFGDRISVGGRVIQVRIVPGPARVLAYHKLVGEVVTHDDPQHRPTVFRRLPRLQHGKWQSVGRLDINTEGLLLFTNSGELANQLMHPRFGVEREYAVRVLGRLDDNGRARLLEGVEIDGQRAAFTSVEDGGGEGVNHWYRVVINEGRNREVRKLFDKVGLGVSRLIRIRYGCVVLPRGLKRGVFVDLHGGEVAQLRSLASPRGGPGGGPGGAQKGQPGPQQPREPRREVPAEVRQDSAVRDSQRPGDNRDRNDQAFGGLNNKRNRRGKRGNDPRDRSPQSQSGGGGFVGPNPGPDGGQNSGQNAGQFAGPRNGPRAPFVDRGADRPPRQIAERQPRREPDRDFSREPAHEFSREPDRDRDEHIDFRAIPNPLMQTFDKRAIRDARQPRREIAEDGPIPNPLEQTFDKRFVQKPRGFGGDGPRHGGQGGNGGQPDPMKTSVGYIGADAFVRKFQSSGAGGGGGGGFGGGGGGGGGGGAGGGGGGGGGNRGGGKRGGRR